MRPRATRFLGVVSLCVFPLVFLFTSGASAEEARSEPSTVQPRIVQPVDETRLTVLKGNTHRMARAQFDQGVAPTDLPMERMLLVLKRSPEQDSALHKLLDDQQDKASPNYHKWLTPEQFGKRFGPADQDIQVVTAWLQSHGFRIGSVAKGRNMIEFSGTAAQVQEALHTSIHKYLVNGEEHWANSSDPQIPTALTPVVAGVHTLHNFLKKPLIHFSQEKVSAKYIPGKPPEVNFSNGVHGLGPADYATIYNINPLYSGGVAGTGVTIGVVARSDLYNAAEDVSDFRNVFGCCGYPNRIYNGPDPGDLGGGEEFEATLDATWPNSVAPQASVNFVISATTNTTDGVDLSELYIIDNNLADIMTESFGSCEAASTDAEAQGIATLAEQAAAQGITYMVSTGDSGAEGCDNPNVETVATGPVSVNLLASTPYNVAVGGTIFNENGQTKYWSTTEGNGYESAVSYIPENVWNESCLASQCGQSAGIWAGGGGASAFFPKPSWQAGVAGIPNDGHRDLPDVSLTAAGHDPYLICFESSCVPDSNGQFFLYFVGGTSASAPSFAGMMALVDQKMSDSGFSRRQGQANYVLYKLAATEKLSQCNASNTSGLPASTCIFNDVTKGNNAVPGEVNYGKSNAQYQSTVGYDLATGLGSVNVTNLVNNWATATFKPSVTTLSVNPTTITHGQAVSVDITVAPQSGTGTPTGDVSLIASVGGAGSSGVPMSAYTLTAGVLNATTNALPGGTYTVTAHYAGDATFSPSDSTAFGPITVNQEASTTTAVALGYPDQNGHFPNFTSGPYGTFVYLRADVKGQSGFGTPTGTISFSDNIPGNPYALNSEGNTAAPNGLFNIPAGAHSVVANYSGDNSFNTSSSGPVNFTITPAATTTTATLLGTALTANIATRSGGDGPSGTVTFFVDGAQVGTPLPVTGSPGVINVQGDIVAKPASATATLTLSAGPKSSFRAVYSGDANYVASTSSTSADFTLTAGTALVTVPTQGGSGAVTLTLTAVNGFVGGVQFSGSSCSGLPSESACSFSPASLSGNGTTTLTITTKAPATAMLRRENRQSPGWWGATGGLTLAGVLLLGVPSKRRRASMLLSLMVAGLLTLSACGGGGGSSNKPPPDPGTPFGKSTVVVTATSGGLKHTASFTLNVQ
jgi:hypothetical protein